MRLSFKTALACLLVLCGAPIAAQAKDRVCTFIVDMTSGKPLVREGDCALRLSPASTFKVALALIGYDSGLLTDAHTPKLTFRPGTGSSMQDRAEADPEIWLRDSLVWYSRELTAQLGKKHFGDYIRKLGYGNADLSGDKGKYNGISQAWLDSSLNISADEQVAFMRRLARCDLPVAPDACTKTKATLPRFTAEGGWSVTGKTGTVLYRANPNGVRTGWFVGWAEKGERKIVFALMHDHAGNKPLPASLRVRDAFLKDLPALVK